MYKLHVLHDDYPLAPEKLETPYDVLSNYCKKFAHEYGIKIGKLCFITEIFSCTCL